MQTSSESKVRVRRKPRVICAGTAMMDALPAEDPIRRSEAVQFEIYAGGTAANVAVGLSRLGRRVSFVGRVGRDPFGETLERCLKANGVDTSHLSYSELSRTALMVLGNGKTKRSFYRQPGADSELTSAAVADLKFDDVLLLYTDSTCMTGEPSRSVVRQLLRKSIGQNVITSFDVNLRGELWANERVARNNIRYGIRFANIVKSTAEELRAVIEQKSLDKCLSEAFRLSKNLQLLVITFGKKGSLLKSRSEECYAPSYKVKQVDSTGCGDAFMAALLHQVLLVQKELSRLDCLELRNIAEFANAAGALTATREGTIPAIPTKREINAFLSVQGRNTKC